jgi:two-component system, LytTR family, sensor kinase
MIAIDNAPPQPPTAETPHRPRWRLWWVLAFAWWTVDGFTSATDFQVMSGGDIGWERALRAALVSAWMWVPLTIFALWLADRYPLERGRWRRHLPVHLAAVGAVILLRALLVLLLNRWIGWYRVLPGFSQVLVTSVANNLSEFGLLVGVGHALVYARRYRERDERLARAELHALKMQLHPHFLFNALNTVTSFVGTDPERAERMIARLSELLRRVLESGGTQEVALEEELRFLRTYLEIEQARFEDRLNVRWAVDPEVYAARVPHLLLQPLVENAIRHGIAPRAAPATVAISAARMDGELRLEVRDDGVGLRGAAESTGGVGLANTRARLRQLYGPRHVFEVADAPGGGVVVRVGLPFRTAGGNRE